MCLFLMIPTCSRDNLCTCWNCCGNSSEICDNIHLSRQRHTNTWLHHLGYWELNIIHYTPEIHRWWISSNFKKKFQNITLSNHYYITLSVIELAMVYGVKKYPTDVIFFCRIYCVTHICRSSCKIRISITNEYIVSSICCYLHFSCFELNSFCKESHFLEQRHITLWIKGINSGKQFMECAESYG